MNENDVLVDEQSSQISDIGSVPTEGAVSSEVNAPFDIYSVENPLPVVLVEDEPLQEELEVYALSGVYNGTISDTYLDYFEGIVEKLDFNNHYVIWRSGQYAYSLAYGKNLQLERNVFSGESNVVELYRSADSYNNTWYVSTFIEDVNFDATTLFVYSDLGAFPTVERGFKHCEATLVVFLAVLMFLISTFNAIFKSCRR